MATQELHTEKASQTGFSMYRPKQDTKLRLDQIKQETGGRIDDDVLRLLCDEHYQLVQVTSLGVDLSALVSLLVNAAQEDKDAVGYLAGLLEAKREFKASYQKRHEGKDYTVIPTSKLVDIKMPGAAAERFRRAVAAVMAYNDAAGMPEMRWFINPSVLVNLVGGRPSEAQKYIAAHPEIAEHHAKHKLTLGSNRHGGVEAKDRITVPELPEKEESEAGASEPVEVETGAGAETEE